MDTGSVEPPRRHIAVLAVFPRLFPLLHSDGLVCAPRFISFSPNPTAKG